MISEDDFDIAGDTAPDLAFVRLERKFRTAYTQNISQSESSSSYNFYTLEYINHTIAAATALEIDLLRYFRIENIKESDIFDNYRSIRQIVDEFSVQVQIKYAREKSYNKTLLNDNEKTKLRSYVNKIKEIIDKSNLINSKKERLFNRINEFLDELDKDRTSLQRFTDIVLTLCTTAADAAEELEPTWKWVRLAGEVLGARKEKETEKLPPPPKRIEPPRPKSLEHKDSDVDDEIPF
ncbi:hypothetical protein [Ancylobacter sp. FA202]|uniref:hypothetical protein n=1 Tax=Ancylobacter sp. FA202 TaxID=1111106 RepID=UPI0012DBCBAA|nr:hypothetical protein [Ancylobacter sp. FA202]